MTKRRFFEFGGIAAGVILIAFGAAAIVMGFNGRAEVRDSLAQENIVGTPDSTIPVQKVDTGAEAKAFANVMQVHTLDITGGQTNAEMGRFLDEKGNATSDEAVAAKDPKTGAPVENGMRQGWVTQTALATALNMAFLAEQIALFGIMVGFALLLSGIGLVVLAVGGALRRREPVAAPARATTGTPVPSN